MMSYTTLLHYSLHYLLVPVNAIECLMKKDVKRENEDSNVQY